MRVHRVKIQNKEWHLILCLYSRLEIQLQDLLESKAQLETELESVKFEKKSSKKKNLADIVKSLEQQINELTQKAAQDRQKMQNLVSELDEKEAKMEALLQLKLETSAEEAKAISRELGLDAGDCSSETETSLKERIDSLEKTNQVFIKALSDADQIWATMEEDYKEKIRKMEASHESQITELNNELTRLTGELTRISDKSEYFSKIEDLEISNAALKTQMEIVLDESLVKMQAVKGLERENEVLRERIQSLYEEVAKKNKENVEEEEQLREKQTVLLENVSWVEEAI